MQILITPFTQYFIKSKIIRIVGHNNSLKFNNLICSYIVPSSFLRIFFALSSFINVFSHYARACSSFVRFFSRRSVCQMQCYPESSKFAHPNSYQLPCKIQRKAFKTLVAIALYNVSILFYLFSFARYTMLPPYIKIVIFYFTAVVISEAQ